MFLLLTNCVVIPRTCVNVVNIETITNCNDQNVVHYNIIYYGYDHHIWTHPLAVKSITFKNLTQNYFLNLYYRQNNRILNQVTVGLS